MSLTFTDILKVLPELKGGGVSFVLVPLLPLTGVVSWTLFPAV